MLECFSRFSTETCFSHRNPGSWRTGGCSGCSLRSSSYSNCDGRSICRGWKHLVDWANSKTLVGGRYSHDGTYAYCILHTVQTFQILSRPPTSISYPPSQLPCWYSLTLNSLNHDLTPQESLVATETWIHLQANRHRQSNTRFGCVENGEISLSQSSRARLLMVETTSTPHDPPPPRKGKL